MDEKELKEVLNQHELWLGSNTKKGARADLGGADLKGAYLKEANLGAANLVDTDLFGADLSGADLSEANLSEADLSEANLKKANLSRAVILDANLKFANLTEANLRKAEFDIVSLSGAILRRANLREADLFSVNFSSAHLAQADLSETSIAYCDFGDVDFKEIKGLETVFHTGPSTIGIDTIYKSKGQIPEVFLRGCGVPEDFIEYMPSLVGKAIEFYSRFISYSTKDQEFANRLHAELQAKGVRCWLATEDLKIGDKMRQTIMDSIRVHDKLLLILSEDSVESEWVEEEVESALRQEREQKKTILFPVRLDDAVFESKHAWAQKICTRHIGDFRNWKDHDSYQEGFERLLRDLKVE